MNIAIDVLAILGPDSKNRGIGNYATSQLRKMFEMDKDNKYFLLNFYEDISLKNILNYSDNVSEYYFYLGDGGFLGKEQKYKELLGGIIEKFIKTHQIEVFYFTSLFDFNIVYDMQWFSKIQTVATLYDIIPYVFKEKYLSNKKTLKDYMVQLNNIKEVDKLLAISQSAKDDVVQHLGMDADRIDVIYAGTDECFKKIDISPADERKLKELYRIKNKYIMCTGGDDDRKNIGELIISYANMPEHLIEKYQLVVACKLSKESEDKYYDIAKKYKVRDKVILTNFVPLEHLIQLYNLAHVVAFPSQYEGFGLPVVEAMACGIPVLTSNNSSLGEIAVGAAVLVDPFDKKDITRGLVEILEKTDLNHLKQMGYERVQKFTWDKVSQRSLEVILSLKMERSVVNENKKIAFFTPLPPLQSGISDYSVDILNELSNYFVIDVYIDKGYTPKCILAEGITIYDHSYFNAKKKEYNDVIYQMGNSEFHAYMIDYITKNAGTLVLHDTNLHGLLHHIASKQSDMKLYKQYLYEDFDKSLVNKYVDGIRSGETSVRIYDFLCNGAVTNYSNKIIVHSDYAKKLLLEKNIKRNVRKILSYAKIKEVVDIKQSRDKLSIDQNKFVISAFGHIHENKRIIPILKAFKRISDEMDQVVLYLVGKPAPSIKSELIETIKMNHLENKVIITGYTDLNLFEEYIDATDICLNLRYPYNGETSGSHMRILSKGKCSLVNDLGSFSEIPDNCCAKLKSPEFMSETDEIELIYKQLVELVAGSDLRTNIGKMARKYAVEQLDIKKIAKQYADYINESNCSVITESTLESIIDFIKNNNRANSEDIYKLAETLAYTKGI